MAVNLKMEVEEIETEYSAHMPIKAEHLSSNPDQNVNHEIADLPETIKSEVHDYDSPDFGRHPCYISVYGIPDYQGSYQGCIKTESVQLDDEATSNFKSFSPGLNGETFNSVPQKRNSIPTVELPEIDIIRSPGCCELMPHPGNTTVTAHRPDEYIHHSGESSFKGDIHGGECDALRLQKNRLITKTENEVDKQWESHLSELRQPQRNGKAYTKDGDSSCCIGTKCSINSKNLMLIHVLQNTRGKPHECSACGGAFASVSKLNSHILTHTRQKRHACSTCGKTFARVSGLKIHMFTHTGEKPHECSTCGKTFSHSSTLKKHIWTHTAEKPHGCSTCGKTFAHVSSLKNHMLTHTGEKPHGCSTCGKTFAQMSNMKSHMLVHTGEKPHGCSICRKSFSHLSTLRRHILTHTGEKPHRCSICGNRFSQMTTLRNHILIHTREESLVCPTCGRTFSRVSSLRRHIMKHT